jgi:hypothetical protein
VKRREVAPHGDDNRAAARARRGNVGWRRSAQPRRPAGSSKIIPPRLLGSACSTASTGARSDGGLAGGLTGSRSQPLHGLTTSVATNVPTDHRVISPSLRVRRSEAGAEFGARGRMVALAREAHSARGRVGIALTLAIDLGRHRGHAWTPPSAAVDSIRAILVPKADGCGVPRRRDPRAPAAATGTWFFGGGSRNCNRPARNLRAGHHCTHWHAACSKRVRREDFLWTQVSAMAARNGNPRCP